MFRFPAALALVAGSLLQVAPALACFAPPVPGRVTQQASHVQCIEMDAEVLTAEVIAMDAEVLTAERPELHRAELANRTLAIARPHLMLALVDHKRFTR